MAIDCFKGVKIKKIKAAYESKIKEGMSDKELRDIGTQVALDYFNTLDKKMAKLRNGLGNKNLKPSPVSFNPIELIKNDKNVQENEASKIKDQEKQVKNNKTESKKDETVNEKAPIKDTKPNGSVQPGTKPNVQQGESKEAQPTPKSESGKTKAEVKPKNRTGFNKGVARVQKIAEKYKKVFIQKSKEISRSYELDRSNNPVYKLFPKVSKMISEAYESVKNEPNKKEVKKAYEAMVEETKLQYEFIVSKGLKVIRHEGEGEPYTSSKDMLSDVRENNTIKFLPNEIAFGQNDQDVSDNIGLQSSGIKLDDGYELTNSEVFRVVHDYFGHGILGNQFGAIGEENATLQHLDLYSDEAAPAVIFLTRGQNSWVNFSGVNTEANDLRKQARELRKQGKTKEANKLLEKANKIFKFAEQKVGIFPNKFNYRRHDTARRISEQAEIDNRSKKRANVLSRLLETYTARSRRTRGVNKRNIRKAKTIGLFNVNTIAEYSLDSKIGAEIKKAFPKHKGVQKIYEITDGEVYRKMVIDSLENNPFASSVTVHTAEEFNGMRMFVTEDGSTGITLTKEGFLGGAFSDPKAKRPQNLAHLMILGIKEGATTAEAFDTILPDYYSKFGFKAVSRTAFNDEYRPLVENGNAVKDWDYDTYRDFNNGRPDVVFFIYDGGDRNTIEERLGLFDLYKNYEKANTESFDKNGYEQAEEVMKQQAVKRLEYERDKEKTTQGKTSKEQSKAERKSVANAKIDDIVDAIKGFDNIFGIKIKIDDIDGVNKNGIDIVDVIASIVKKAVEAGIEIDIAIKETIAHLKKSIDFDVNIDEIKTKIIKDSNPKSTTSKNNKKSKKTDSGKNQTFERKAGQKSILTRAATGNANKDVVAALKEYGLDYEIESQEETYKRAKDFVEKNPSDLVYKTLLSGAIQPDAELAFIFSEYINSLEKKIIDNIRISNKDTSAKSKELIKRLEAQKQEMVEKQKEIILAFDDIARNAGRFIAALNKVYKSSLYEYNLSRQIELKKARNGGVITKKEEKALIERDKKIKNLETELSQAKKALEDAEARRAISNIQESIDREKKGKKRLRKKLSDKEEKRKKELYNELFGSLNDVTRMLTLLGEPKFREYLSLVLKQAGNDFQNFSNDIVDKFGEASKGIMDKLYDAAQNKKSSKSETKTKELEVIIDKNNNIKIPEKIIRQYIEDGVKDPNELIDKIINEHLKVKYPNINFLEKDVRDAITGYGKTTNRDRTEIDDEISEIKNLLKLISALEDVNKGNSPLKSGVKQREKTERELIKQKEVKRKMAELGITDADTEKQWKTRLQTAKTRVENQISELNKQIKDNQRRRVERIPLKKDDILNELIKTRDRLKKELDDKVGPPQLTDKQKVQRIENALETQISKLQEKIFEGEVSFTQTKDAPTSDKIKILKKVRNSLTDQLNKAREDSGLIEERRLKNAKKSVDRRLAELKQKRKNKDYSKKVQKPLKEDKEYKLKRAELRKEKEKYDQDAFRDELKNRGKLEKALSILLGVTGVPRVLMATGELSAVFLQNGATTVNLAIRNPRKLREIIKKTAKSSLIRNFKDSEAMLQEGEYYDLALQSGVALTKTDYKQETRNEEFQGEVFEMLFKSLNYIPGIEKGEDANLFALFERLTNTYGNEVKMALFESQVKKLEKKGKSFIENEREFKDLANVINTLTGRASMGKTLDSSNPILNLAFFSARFAASTFNKTINFIPFYFYSGNYEQGVASGLKKSITDPSIAQKLFISQMMTYIGTMSSLVLLISALGGEDENGNKNIELETDPTSSNFGKLNIGNLYIDGFGGMLPWIVLSSRIISGEYKKSNGKKLKLNKGNNRTYLNLLGDFTVNKFNPFIATPFRLADASLQEDGVRRNAYDEEVSIKTELSKLYPIYLQGIVEYIEEGEKKMPLTSASLILAGLLGINNQLYGSTEKDHVRTYANDANGVISTKKQDILIGSKEVNGTSEKQMNQLFLKFIETNESETKDLTVRIDKAIQNAVHEDDIIKSLELSQISRNKITTLLMASKEGFYSYDKVATPFLISEATEKSLDNKIERLRIKFRNTEEKKFTPKEKEWINQINDLRYKKERFNDLRYDYNNIIYSAKTSEEVQDLLVKFKEKLRK